jgi:hypothetical protein
MSRGAVVGLVVVVVVVVALRGGCGTIATTAPETAPEPASTASPATGVLTSSTPLDFQPEPAAPVDSRPSPIDAYLAPPR